MYLIWICRLFQMSWDHHVGEKTLEGSVSKAADDNVVGENGAEVRKKIVTINLTVE